MTHCIRYIYVFLFYSISINAMNDEKNICKMTLLIPDLVKEYIQSLISYQDIGRLKQCSTWCNALYNTDQMSSFGYRRLADNYYACSKALGHYACMNNERAFASLWKLHARYRDPHKGTLAEHMIEYRGFYDTAEKVKHSIASQISLLLQNNSKDLAIILSGSNADIVGEHYFSALKKMMLNACRSNNESAVKELYMGVISSKTVPFIMIDAPCGLIEKLIDEKILDSKILDQRDNTLLHCAVFFNRSDIIPMLLQKGVYVNARNKLQETPLHWAVNLYSNNCVVGLLAHPDINTQARNWLNKKASFYVSKRKMFWEVYSSEQKNKMRLIRNILKQHNKARKNNHAQRGCGEKYKSLK